MLAFLLLERFADYFEGDGEFTGLFHGWME